VSTDNYILPAGRVAGVRTWRLAPTLWAKMGGWLWSMTLSDCWRKGEEYEWKEAQCDFGHEPPGEGCTCGIYAYNEVGKLLNFMNLVNLARTRKLRLEPLETASGVIIADGGIIPGSYGFRCEYAKVAAIFEHGLPALATPQEIAEHYRCDIITVDEYDAFCAKHGLRRLDLEG
jgi:hypothetical protein